MKYLSRHSRIDQKGPITLAFRMVPMIDVVFLLLIFFVLTANFRASEGYLPTVLPSEETAPSFRTELDPLSVWLEPADKQGCLVTISGGVQFEISDTDDQNWLPLCREVQRILRRQGRRLDDPVRLAPSPQTRWDYVVRAYDALWRMNLTNIIFAVGTAHGS